MLLIHTNGVITGEWFELLSGYSNYAEYRGAIHILYGSQARTAEDGIRLKSNCATYKESVHQQLVSSFANTELQRDSKKIYEDFYADRKRLISDKALCPTLFVVLPARVHVLINLWTYCVRKTFKSHADQTDADSLG